MRYRGLGTGNGSPGKTAVTIWSRPRLFLIYWYVASDNLGFSWRFIVGCTWSSTSISTRYPEDLCWRVNIAIRLWIHGSSDAKHNLSTVRLTRNCMLGDPLWGFKAVDDQLNQQTKVELNISNCLSENAVLKLLMNATQPNAIPVKLRG